MQSNKIKALGIFLVMASLAAWLPQFCLAQGDIYTGKVISQNASTITLDLDPCGAESRRRTVSSYKTVSPYKPVGTPQQTTCPNGKVYTKLTVVESNGEIPAKEDTKEFSGKIISESKDTITLDLTPCGTKTLKVISPYEKKGSAVDASCPNGEKYSKSTVVEHSSNDKVRN